MLRGPLALTQLLISTVHRINAHAEQKVIAELVKDYKRVTGKETLLRKIAEASLGMPDDPVREVIYLVVGGEATLKISWLGRNGAQASLATKRSYANRRSAVRRCVAAFRRSPEITHKELQACAQPATIEAVPGVQRAGIRG